MLKISEITAEYEPNPVGISKNPRFSWIIESDRNGTKQESFTLEISKNKDFSGEVITFSEKSDCSVAVRNPDFKEEPLTKYYYRVKITDNFGRTSDFSKQQYFVTAHLLENEWKGEFVTIETEEDKDRSNATYLKKEFKLKRDVKEAYVLSTSLGLYNLFIDGEKVGNDELTPGWTSYKKHLCYQMYEVTDLLKKGYNHCVGALLGAGYYKGVIGFYDARNNYGKYTAFLCELHIIYTDGSSEIIPTDETWTGKESPVLFSEIYDGEVYDARLETEDWCTPEVITTGWKKVHTVFYDKSVLTSQAGAKVKEVTKVEPVRIFTTPKGEKVIDFGQNMAGIIHVMKDDSKNGDEIELDCFEELDKEGNVYIENLRGAKNRLLYISKGGKIDYHPHFTYMGFRYAYVKSWPGEIGLSNITAYSMHSNMEQIGTFSSSNPLLNRLWQNILWSMKSNFVDIPTDCPQRNERCGWTGDAQIFCKTASFLMNTYVFFEKWLLDVACDQTSEGGVSHVVPDFVTEYEHIEDDWLLTQGSHSAAGWADVIVLNPWNLYLSYGDIQILIDMYEPMKAWIDFMEAHSEGYIWNYRLQFGDWVALDAKEGSYFGATPNELTCTAYFAYSTGVFAKIAGILGKDSDYKYYSELEKKIKDVFTKHFFDPETKGMKVQTQTAHILSLRFGLTPEQYREQTVKELLMLLEKENGHLLTGFMGTPHFTFALSDNDCLKEAYELLLKEDFPSWLYQVKKGATTVWEHWDGIKPDGSMWSADMNSFNHYSYGSVGEWLYRVITGINQQEDSTGYKKALIYPRPGGNITSASASLKTPYGLLKSEWEINGNRMTLKVRVPMNTVALIKLDNVKTVNGSIINGTFTEEVPGGDYVFIAEM